MSESDVDHLTIDVEVSYEVEQINDLCAFIDSQQRRLYLLSSADHDDVLDEVASEVTRLLWPGKPKEVQDTVRTFLGVSSIERFRKLRDKKDWQLSPEKRVFCPS